MRKIVRLDAPDCLQANDVKWSKRFVERRTDNAKAKFAWSKICYPHMLDTLLTMTQRHCAFCDGPLGIESRETIEHFRPKDSFPQLAYTWSNLFPCCDVCQAAKLEKFDERLLKPDELHYQFSDYFMVSFETGALSPALTASLESQERAQVTIDFYDLDKAERRKARLKELKAFCPQDGDHLNDFNYRFFLEWAL